MSNYDEDWDGEPDRDTFGAFRAMLWCVVAWCAIAAGIALFCAVTGCTSPDVDNIGDAWGGWPPVDWSTDAPSN